MKYEPKKVFIMENGKYTEYTYQEFCTKREQDTSFENRFFIPSRQTKSELPTHVTLTAVSLECKSVIMLEQIRTIDKSRLLDYIGSLSEENMKLVNEALAVSLGIEQP